MEKTKLEMEFLDQSGKKFIVSLDEPRSDLTPLEVSEAMNTILTYNVFKSSTGDLDVVSDARIITTTVNTLEI